MDEDNEENEGDVESDGADKVEKKKGDLKAIRRLSCSLESQNEGQFLSVPHASITASSSAETLTDNTITAPSTPTNLIANRLVSFILYSLLLHKVTLASPLIHIAYVYTLSNSLIYSRYALCEISSFLIGCILILEVSSPAIFW